MLIKIKIDNILKKVQIKTKTDLYKNEREITINKCKLLWNTGV